MRFPNRYRPSLRGYGDDYQPIDFSNPATYQPSVGTVAPTVVDTGTGQPYATIPYYLANPSGDQRYVDPGTIPVAPTTGSGGDSGSGPWGFITGLLGGVMGSMKPQQQIQTYTPLQPTRSTTPGWVWPTVIGVGAVGVMAVLLRK